MDFVTKRHNALVLLRILSRWKHTLLQVSKLVSDVCRSALLTIVYFYEEFKMRRQNIIINAIFIHITIEAPAKVAQLVGTNTGKCDPSKWYMVLGSNPIIDNTLNLPSAGCYRVANTPRFGSPWKVLRVWP